MALAWIAASLPNEERPGSPELVCLVLGLGFGAATFAHRFAADRPLALRPLTVMRAVTRLMFALTLPFAVASIALRLAGPPAMSRVAVGSLLVAHDWFSSAAGFELWFTGTALGGSLVALGAVLHGAPARAERLRARMKRGRRLMRVRPLLVAGGTLLAVTGGALALRDRVGREIDRELAEVTRAAHSLETGVRIYVAAELAEAVADDSVLQDASGSLSLDGVSSSIRARVPGGLSAEFERAVRPYASAPERPHRLAELAPYRLERSARIKRTSVAFCAAHLCAPRRSTAQDGTFHTAAAIVLEHALEELPASPPFLAGDDMLGAYFAALVRAVRASPEASTVRVRRTALFRALLHQCRTAAQCAHFDPPSWDPTPIVREVRPTASRLAAELRDRAREGTRRL